jgi:hypothetical protein
MSDNFQRHARFEKILMDADFHGGCSGLRRAENALKKRGTTVVEMSIVEI